MIIKLFKIWKNIRYGKKRVNKTKILKFSSESKLRVRTWHRLLHIGEFTDKIRDLKVYWGCYIARIK